AALPLQLPEEAIEAEALEGEIMGRGQPGDDAAVQSLRTKNDLFADDGDEEVRDRDLTVLRGARTAEKGDLIAPQHGPQQDVADAAFREMNDLGKYRLGIQRLLGPQMR